MNDASVFPVSSEAEWRALVEKTLKGEPVESLRSTTVEGLVVEPLYAPAAEPAAFQPRSHHADRPWDVRARVAHPDAAAANRQVLTELESGAASVLLRLDASGASGVAIGSADGMAALLGGVMLELAPVALDAGFLGPKAADWLATVAKGSPAARLALHLDPLSAWAEAGLSPGPVESHVISAATVASRLADAHPQASLFLASGRVAHEAGAGEAGELAFAIAAAVTYAKAGVRAGLSMEAALGGIVLGLAAGADYFLTIAKLRAARLLWDRVAEACGAATPARIEARSSARMLTVQDPWTNMLRLTSAAFGAAVGGADALVLGAFTDAIGRPSAFARRQSRNTQLVLMEEAHLGRVADPSAGAGYIEDLTRAIAEAAWTRFQNIEAAGGLVTALSAGLIARDVAAAVAARAAAGVPKIVGVTAFPPTAATEVEVDRETPTPVEAPSPRLPGPDSRCPPLAPIRIAAEHEVGR